MAAQKRVLDDAVSAQEEVDFPRGGGTSFTPLEVKTIRAEAVKEADEKLFKQDSQDETKGKKRKRKHQTGVGHVSEKSERTRVEHLNYKKINVGMRILGQVVLILPLSIVVSLPNQMFGHIPITNINTHFTRLLEAEEQSIDISDDEDENVDSAARIPELLDIFCAGQYVRTIVTAVHASGTNDASGISKSRNEVAKASKRLELSVDPALVNAGVQKVDLKSGFTLSATVKSLEDHGYILDMGVQDTSGFLSFKDPGISSYKRNLSVGQLVNATISQGTSNGRTYNVSVDPTTFASSCLTEVSSVSSILPGALVQGLITACHSDGIVLQVLGFFDGTIDSIHLRHGEPKVGKKIKARVIYEYSSSPIRFSLATVDHLAQLEDWTGEEMEDDTRDKKSIRDSYPIGTILDPIKVKRVEAERGLFVEVHPGVDGFVHISHVSDEHIPSLSTNSSWKPGSLHRARVVGYFDFDGLLQLSLKRSVLDQKFLQVADLSVGEVVKGTIKKLTDTNLFISLSGNVDGVIWPIHYADIMLKHPAKRFKLGSTIRCRVLVVDPARQRIFLTAKKTLIDSELPILSNFEEAKPGMTTHAVVTRVHDKHIIVEFYNGLRAIIPMKEASETPLKTLTEAFQVGKVIRVRIIATEEETRRIIASVKQTSGVDTNNINAIEIGDTVDATISDIHKDNIVLTLQQTKIRALLSLKNLANQRNLSLPQLRANLKVGEQLTGLIVVTRNVDKGIVIVANKPKAKILLPNNNSSLSLDDAAIGQLVDGRVTRHTRYGALIKITNHIGGILHLTDALDDYGAVDVDRDKKQLVLSTRASRLHPDIQQNIVDREINAITELSVGDTIRSYIKNVGDHGLFVSIGRSLDGRVQIRELFDEYVKDWKSRFHNNLLVKGRVLSMDNKTNKVELTLRSGELLRKAYSALTLTDIHEGMKVEGLVKKITDYGLFIQIGESKLTGLCHKSELSDNQDADIITALHGFREGDRVKAVVIAIDNRRISFSLKPSHFNYNDFGADGVEEARSHLPLLSSEESISDLDVDNQVQPSMSSLSDGGTDEDEVDAMEIDTETPSFIPATSEISAPEHGSLPFLGGFQWNSNHQYINDKESTETSDESDADDQAIKKKKRKKRIIEQDLTADMHMKAPESNADFERLLLGSPNSSYLWIQYMSFQLQLSEVGKAREIARRAVKAINFREDQERLNVWIALLNLEIIYGTEESLDLAFKDAAKANDSKTIHLRLAAIFDQTDKVEKAEEQFKRTCKKFGHSSKVWTLFSEHYLRRGRLEDARQLLPRSLQSLERRKHLKTINKFAQLEYKYGDPERGKTLFEGMIDSHPKRWDIWSIYMDMEYTQKNIHSLRLLFDRVLALKMTSHKAKSYFKKWLEFERKIGDAEGAEAVKQKAIEWTLRASNSAS
ncbi:U3 snoRNP-associated protein Rrp5 [Cyathus striatus]|nr:U3 snoRNP-associated protein Rrp5 [Cyathus striatus]